MSKYFDGLNAKLFNSIPSYAKNVLELGCANGRLGQAYKKKFPNCRWTGVDIDEGAVKNASTHLDEVRKIDLDSELLNSFSSPFDVIVIGDLLEHLKTPERLLENIHEISTEDAVLVCCVPNATHVSVVERILSGDFSYDESGLLDKTHLRLFSSSSLTKTLLDCGWIPTLSDHYDTEIPNTKFTDSVINATSSLGISSRTALRFLALYQMIFTCRKWEMEVLRGPGRAVPFSVIVPVNNQRQYELNIQRSPGLREMEVETIAVSNATDAASAYEYGANLSKTEWNLFVHQDVYFPVGSGFAISRHLGSLTNSDGIYSAVGFAGLDYSKRKSGLVVDRQTLFCNPPTASARSIDEFAVAIHKSSRIKIDPRFGWHLWGTDLCLQSLEYGKRYNISIVKVPLFHNSYNDYHLPDQFLNSLERLFSKYTHLESVSTLCGEFSRLNVSEIQRVANTSA